MSCDSKAIPWVCGVAWISQGLPEPLTWVRIPADPSGFEKEYLITVYVNVNLIKYPT